MMKAISVRISTIALGALLLAVGASSYAELPSVKLLSAPLVQPSDAWTYYTTDQTHTIGVAATSSVPAEIVELSNALSQGGGCTGPCFADAVYEYVRDNIETEFRFGLGKGARGALIDQSGTPFDQAALMVALLRAGGATASYQVGTISLTAQQFGQWSGLVTGLVPASQSFSVNMLAACQFLADGGIPATVNSATTCTGLSGTLPLSGTPIVMGHIWVVSNGVLYDPSFKSHVLKAPITDLSTAMQCGTNCGANVLSLIPAVHPVTTGVNGVSGISQSSIEGKLQLYATNLQTWIQTYNANNAAYLQVEDLLGGAIIDPSAAFSRGATLPYPSAVQYSWAGDIPDRFRSSALIQLENFANPGNSPGTGMLVYADEIAGGRLRVWGLGGTLAMYFDGHRLGSSTVATPTSQVSVTISVRHPYAANSGSYADEILSYLPMLRPVPSNLAFVAPTTIVLSFGESSQSTSSHYGALAERDVLATSWDNPTDPNHITVTATSLPVLQQYNCEFTIGATSANPVTDLGCYEPQEATLGAMWLAQSSRARSLVGPINSARIQHHHSAGLVTAMTVVNSFEQTIFNVQSSVSVSSATASSTDRTAAFLGAAAVMSRLEGSIFEQNYDSWEGGSAVSMMVRSSGQGITFLDVNSINVTNATAALSNYTSFELSTISQYAALGRLVLPQNGNLGQFCASGGSSCITYLWNGFATVNSAADRASYITGGFNKGSGSAGSMDSTADVLATTKITDYAIKGRNRYSVDVSTGDLKLEPAPDLVTGNGAFPKSLSFQRVFSSSAASVHCSPYFWSFVNVWSANCGAVNGDLSQLGNGWSHSMAISGRMASDGFAGLGRDSGLSASAAIAALYTQRQLNLATRDIRSDLASIFTTHWLGENLWSNTVIIERPPRHSSFVRLPDGTHFDPGPGSNERFVQSGARVLTGWTSGFATAWDGSAVSFAVTDKIGSTLSLGYIGNNKLFGATQWVFPDGVRLSFSYTTASPGVTQCLTGVSNNLGRSLTFTAPCSTMSPNTLTNVQDDAGRQVSISQSSPICPATLSFTGPDGGATTYAYLAAPTTAVSRTWCRIQQWYSPGNTSIPYIKVSYDSLSRVSRIVDNMPTPDPVSYYIAGIYGTEAIKRSEILDATGGLTTKYFDRWNQNTQSTDPNGNVTKFVYDSNRRLSQKVYPDSNAESYAYDARHNLLSATASAKVGSLSFSQTSTAYVEGPTVATCVSPITCNLPRTTTDANGNVTNYSQIGTTGQLQRVVGPAVTAVYGNGVPGASQIDYCYGSFTGTSGSISLPVATIQKIDASINRVTSFGYNNAAAHLTLSSATKDPALSYAPPAVAGGTCTPVTKTSPVPIGAVTQFAYDAYAPTSGVGPGNVSSVTDANAGITTYRFDLLRRLTTASAPLNAVTRYCYDLDGQLVSTNRARLVTSDPNLASASTTGQCAVAFPTANWQSELKTYWPTGDLKTSTDASGNITQYAYDAVGRKRVVSDPDGRQIATVYDLAGQVIATWRGGRTWLNSDGTVNATSAPTPSASWIPGTYGGSGPLRYAAYAYTGNGKQKLVVDADGNQTQLAYDGLDRLLYTVFPDPIGGSNCSFAVSPTVNFDTTLPTCTGGQTYERSEYDPNGNRIHFWSRKGDLIAFTYNPANETDTKSPAGQGQVTYGYNLAKDQTQISEAAAGSQLAHTTLYDYDSAGRKTYEQNDGRMVSYLYDSVGNRTRTTWPDSYYVAYTYDSLNRMTYVKENGSTELANYSYDTLSRRNYVCLGGQSSQCLANGGTNKQSYTYESDGDLSTLTQVLNSTVVSLGYGHNGSHQINSISANDPFYLPRPAVTSTQAYTPNALNEYGGVGANAFASDLNGNLTHWYSAISQAGAGYQTYTFDSENRMLTAATAGSATPSIFYDYDALGRRWSKLVGTQSTQYLLDGDEEIAEYDGTSGQLLRRYVVGPSIDDRVATIDGNALHPAATARTYFHTNHQGSVIAMTDQAGTATGTCSTGTCQILAYDEYGNLTADSKASSAGQPYRYTGRRYDPETGLYYYRARYYSPQIGRFLQADPSGTSGGLNLYEYASGSPTNLVDALGLRPGDPFPSALAAARDAMPYATRLALRDDKEWGGRIVEISGKFYAESPRQGDHSTFNSNVQKNDAGVYHSHGGPVDSKGRPTDMQHAVNLAANHPSGLGAGKSNDRTQARINQDLNDPGVPYISVVGLIDGTMVIVGPGDETTDIPAGCPRPLPPPGAPPTSPQPSNTSQEQNELPEPEELKNWIPNPF